VLSIGVGDVAIANAAAEQQDHCPADETLQQAINSI
jgi:hypothetical protein